MSYDVWSDPQQDHALKDQNLVLRDSLGTLAVQILSTQEDLSKMEYSEMLRKLHRIIDDLQSAYHQANGDFS